MKKKIKISFVGVGFMSQIAHLVNYFKNTNVELFEICDLYENLANNVKKKFNFTGKTFTDFKKMSINETDGVVIIVQRKLISPIVKYFLSRNCNVFSEKPHAYSVKEYLNLPKSYHGRGGPLLGYRVPVIFPEKEVILEPYALGYWLGDGTSCRPEITTIEEPVIEYFRTYGKKLGLYLLFL